MRSREVVKREVKFTTVIQNNGPIAKYEQEKNIILNDKKFEIPYKFYYYKT